MIGLYLGFIHGAMAATFYLDSDGDGFGDPNADADFVTAPAGSDPAASEFTDLRFWIEDLTNGDRAFKDTTFNGDDR